MPSSGISVAPHAGAWIETLTKPLDSETARSRLTQARGLKPFECGFIIRVNVSRLTQARGLKPVTQASVLPARCVAPHAGAWIETPYGLAHNEYVNCRASRRRVD